ncbi:MAG: S41 family peptidase [Bacteroides sp.]|nr:S41 family peptidase [Bacteroides sp.]
MKKSYPILAVLLLLCTCFSSCKDDDDTLPSEERITTEEIYYANRFASDILSDVYLWNTEISEDISLLDPNTNTDPISTVADIRYSENGKEVDKWTVLTDDYETFINSMSGVETTYGYGLAMGRFTNTGTYFFVVTYVYADSPAADAGIKRGDMIISLNGEDITESNYLNVLYSSSVTLGMGTYTNEGIAQGGNIRLTATQMYENPILAYKIFENGGKTVGYLAYASFDLRSVSQLINICKEFKAAGVTELILDLRYNGGGYVITEEALASMFAPAEEVAAKSLYQTEVWNASYTEYFRVNGMDRNTYFSTDFTVQDLAGNDLDVSTADANIGLNKIYALISSGTASASESLLIGLMPFMDIELLGSNSHGKYCTGAVLQPSDVYKSAPDAIHNWGIYVMINRFADKNGNNPCMPNGLAPDIEVDDNLFDGCQLGDEQETMLNAALTQAGMTNATGTRTMVKSPYDTKLMQTSPLFGKRIDNSIIEKIRK